MWVYVGIIVVFVRVYMVWCVHIYRYIHVIELTGLDLSIEQKQFTV